MPGPSAFYQRPAHGALEMLAGLGLMAAPFALGFGPAGLVVTVLLGALLFGMALSATDERSGRKAERTPWRAPPALGVKVTEIVQRWPGGRAAGHF